MPTESSTSALFVVATPIGNLNDISQRAIDTLNMVDIIAAEDTRHSRTLLDFHNITTKLISLHEHNEKGRSASLVEQIKQGKNIALISDAGTPLISDPGFRLVGEAHKCDVRVSPIPGPCAAIAALSASGLASDRFCFEGFLASKSLARSARLRELQDEPRTMVFYEAPHRIKESLKAMQEVFGVDRPAMLAREISKTFETIKRGGLEQLALWVAEDSNQQRGEIVVLVEGERKVSNQEVSAESSKIMDVLLQELSKKQASSLCSQITGVSKKLLYQYALELK
ncbi:MAG: 16S rRNA (cytidine(1402)-2'-O)-methyltransferase [Gammaproteobacteria bacterium]|nr:MAG: 16S rRNA (cytidine(1402)-2'-O)-methyltransferase [Gammaproteobacteria bacterium]